MLKHNDVVPRGSLLIIGGQEERRIKEKSEETYINKDYEELEILKRFLKSNKKDANIEVITSATSIPNELGAEYLEIFKHLGYNAKILNITNRQEASDEENIDRIRKANAVFFTGGDQFRIITIFNQTEILSVITEKFHKEKNFKIGGTSAGAMAVPKICLYRSENADALLKGDIKLLSGLGFIDHCIIDTHFVRRPRFGRLVNAVLVNQNCVGIGLGENTALEIEEGNLMECYGTGIVVVVDGSQIQYTNVNEIEENQPVNVEGLIVHFLKKGDKYLLNERQFIPGDLKKTEMVNKKN